MPSYFFASGDFKRVMTEAGAVDLRDVLSTAHVLAADEEDGGFALVGGAGVFDETAFPGHADRGGVVRMDDAERSGCSNVGVAPGESGEGRLRGVTLAMEFWSQHPTNFGQRPVPTVEQGERRIEGPFILSVAKFADELAAGKFFDRPVAKAQPEPTAGVAEKTSPNFLARERSAPNVASDRGVGPEGNACEEIFAAMRAQAEPWRFDSGDFAP